MSKPGRWAKYIKEQAENKKKKSAPVYKKDMLNLSMHSDLTRNPVVKTMKDYTPEELEAMKERLLSNPKLQRQARERQLKVGEITREQFDETSTEAKEADTIEGAA